MGARRVELRLPGQEPGSLPLTYAPYLNELQLKRMVPNPNHLMADRKQQIDMLPLEQLKTLVAEHTSYAAVLRVLDITCGQYTRHLKKRVQIAGLDTSHFKGQSWRRGSTQPMRKLPLEEIM